MLASILRNITQESPTNFAPFPGISHQKHLNLQGEAVDRGDELQRFLDGVFVSKNGWVLPLW